MDSKSKWLSRKWRLEPGVTEAFKLLPVMIALLLFLICAPNRMVHQVPQANAGQAQKDSTAYRGEQKSKPDNGRASQVEYVESKRIPIPKTPAMPQEWHVITYEARSAQIQHPDENEWPATLCLMKEDGKGKHPRA